MTADTYEIYAVRYAHHERRASENFYGGDPHDDSHDGQDARFGVYDWLGYRLETIIVAADEAS